jgi:hypothetical protein
MNKRFIVDGPHHRRNRQSYWTVFDKNIKAVVAMCDKRGEAWSLANDLERQYWKEVQQDGHR